MPVGAQAASVSSTTTAYDQEKMLAAKLIQRSSLRMIAHSICEKVQQKKGTGKTAYFIRYKRMNVPLSPISEGVDPTASSFTLEQFTVTLDQWVDVIVITDVSELTTSHPIVSQALDLLADNAQRVIDREVQIVWFAGTNVQYGDSTVTTRRTVNAMKVTDIAIHRARINLSTNGTPPRSGPAGFGAKTQGTGSASSMHSGGAYVGICGPQVMGDIMGTTSWVAIAQYSQPKALYNAEVGTWLSIRWVETNFIPILTRLGDDTQANASGTDFGTNTPVVTANADAGGALKDSVTYFYKVTRKDLLRGFEEAISREHSTATPASGGGAANDQTMSFNFSSLAAGYVYNLYFDTNIDGGAGTDATMKLVSENIAVGTTVTVSAVPSTGANPPDHCYVGMTVHPVYIHGEASCFWVGLKDLSIHKSGSGATTDNPAELRKTLAYKFFAKAMITDQARMLRMEVTSAY